MNNNWRDFFDGECKKEYYNNLKINLKKEYKNYVIYPKRENLFNAFKLTPYENIKVVILGQDPYHNVNQANGLSFSVNNQKLPPSLLNIYKELEDDLGIEISKSGDLSCLAKQGILLLNTCLTVREHSPGSHKDIGWEIFTANVIDYIEKNNNFIIYVLWGNFARSKKNLITNKNRLIIESTHPSSFSARNGFFGSKPFSRINSALTAKTIEAINWRIKIE